VSSVAELKSQRDRSLDCAARSLSLNSLTWQDRRVGEVSVGQMVLTALPWDGQIGTVLFIEKLNSPFMVKINT